MMLEEYYLADRIFLLSVGKFYFSNFYYLGIFIAVLLVMIGGHCFWTLRIHAMYWLVFKLVYCAFGKQVSSRDHDQPCSNSNNVLEDLWGLMFLAFGNHQEVFLCFPQLKTCVGLEGGKKWFLAKWIKKLFVEIVSVCVIETSGRDLQVINTSFTTRCSGADQELQGRPINRGRT